MRGSGAPASSPEASSTPRLRTGRGLVFTALPAIALLAVLGMLLAYLHYRSLLEDRRAETRSLAAAAATNARRFIDDQFATLGAVAASPAVRARDRRALREYLPMVADTGRFSAGVGWVDREGTLRVSSNRGTPVSLADRSYVRAALDERRAAVSDVVIDRTAGRPIIAFGYPTADERGRPAGVLVGSIALDRIDQVLRRLAYAPGAGTTILDGADHVIVGPEPVAGLVPAPRTYPVQRLRGAGAGVLDSVDSADDTRMVGFASVPGTRWIALVDRHRGDLVGPLDRALWAEVGALLALAMLGVFATFATARRLDELGRVRDEALFEQREIAVRLQRSMLPDLPAPPFVEVHADYAPAQGAMAVGGDWYDVVELGDGRVAVSVGDVAGHGLPAAVAMGKLRSAGRMLALQGSGPAEALARLDSFAERLDGHPLATVVYAVLDPDGRLRYACAGHPAPLLLRADGSTQFLDLGRSALLGVEPGLPRFEADERLGGGDTLILYTDGVIEQPGASLDAGMRALAERARTTRGDTAALANALLAAVPEPRRDDAAVLCVRIRPQPSSVAS